MTTLVREAPPADNPASTFALTPLINELDRALRDRPADIDAADRAANCLRDYLPTPDILSATDQLGDPDCYRQHVLFVDPAGRYSVVAFVWREGQLTTIHDHRCWGAVAVLQGAEYEVQYSLRSLGGRPRLAPGRRTRYPSGEISAFAPPGDIHQVRNGGRGVAISLHVYGADIARFGSSIRRSYSEDLVCA